MSSALYNGYKVNAAKGAIAFLTDTIKVALLKSTYTPDIDNHKFFSDVIAQESSGTGYTTGGNTLTSPTVTEDDVNDRAVLSGANVAWPTATIADARYAVIYKSTGNNATSPLIGYIDLLATKSWNGDTAQINWNALGIFSLT